MNDFDCGSGPSPISERLSLFKEIIRISKKKEERTIVGDFSYQNVKVVELVAILNYIIALYNFGLHVEQLYSIVEVYEEVKNETGNCYFYILDFIEKNFQSIHPVLFMLDHYTKEVYDLLRDEGQMIGKFQFYIMAKAIASYEVHTQDVINDFSARLNQYNKDVNNDGSLKGSHTNNSRFSSSSDTTIVEDSSIESTIVIDNTDSTEVSFTKDDTYEEDITMDNDANSTKQIIKELSEEELYNLDMERKSIIYECLTSLNVYSNFQSFDFDIPPHPTDELLKKIENN